MKAIWDKLVLWFLTTLFCWFIAIYLGLIRRRKMSHNNGVSGRGRIRVVEDQRFPPHPFFAPGAEFGARVRHASAGFMDDGMVLVRSLSLKFADAPVASPLDLELNSGRSLFWTARNFLQFVFMRRNKRGVCYTEWYKRYPAGREAARDSLVRLPGSYHTLEYTSQCPLSWVGTDGVQRYACYRVVPHGAPLEPSGLDEARFGRFEGSQQLDPAEPRDRNYLKREWVERVARGPIEYLIQVQTREAKAGEDPEIFNSNKPWDAAQFPWHDLATVTIDRALGWEDDQFMWFSLSHHPPGLGILPAKSIDDPNSLNYMRAKSDIAKRARIWALKRRGVWPRLPNHGERNVDEFNDDAELYPEGVEAARLEQKKSDASWGAAG
ncbi:MAG: hypothetical protein R3F39_06800 [Myxococcota bacterium]